jgi:dienelactone hydrolase
LIAGITREVMHDYEIDPQRVYVAGLSAGGAAAAIMGDAYPDLYAAIGVHSGLACGAARHMPSAFAAMQRGSDGSAPRAAGAARSGSPRRVVPAIVFHGDQDPTVNPRNGEAVVAQSAHGAALKSHAEEGQVPGGYAYSRTLHADANGQTVIEQWVIHGAGHAWFGGSPTRSYTDPRGPDATGEMLRFFLEQPHPTASQGLLSLPPDATAAAGSPAAVSFKSEKPLQHRTWPVCAGEGDRSYPSAGEPSIGEMSGASVERAGGGAGDSPTARHRQHRLRQDHEQPPADPGPARLLQHKAKTGSHCIP